MNEGDLRPNQKQYRGRKLGEKGGGISRNRKREKSWAFWKYEDVGQQLGRRNSSPEKKRPDREKKPKAEEPLRHW